jgi:hypothetical protein
MKPRTISSAVIAMEVIYIYIINNMWFSKQKTRRIKEKNPTKVP